MVYLLKFGASFILPPGIFIVFLFFYSIHLWKHSASGGGIYGWQRPTLRKKVAAMLMAFTIIFYLFCTPWMAEKAMGWLEGAYQPPKKATGDVVIMLGGGAYADTPDVSGQGTLCAAPSARLLTAVRLQRQLDVPILLSGGQVYEDTGAEAKIAKRILMDLGVPEEKILVEDQSLNTTQNARYSAQLMQEKGLKNPVLVTSAFHMKRAMLNFQKQGYEPVPFPSDYRTGKKHVFHYVKLRPSVDAMYDNAVVLQETLRTLVTRYFE